MTHAKRILAILLVVASSGCARSEKRSPVVVVTTPEVAGIGIVEMLTERFSRETKVAVTVIVTEGRLVSRLVDDGTADVVVTVSPGLRQDLGRRGAVRLAQVIGYDDYLLVGPKRDRARAGKAKNAAEALRRIARKDRAFCSPVDVPELRYRESLLWEASPAEPDDDRRYRTCRGTPSEVLREASRRSAYTLTDRATFESIRKDLRLVPLLQGTPLLHDDVTILLIGHGKARPDAEWFVQWVMSYRGREQIERYRYDGGRRLFVQER